MILEAHNPTAQPPVCQDFWVTEPFVKRRDPATPGSIPDVLQMFVNEVRFYREIAPVIGIRVPRCLAANQDNGATRLALENLSEWESGGSPPPAARMLAGMHAEIALLDWEDVGTGPGVADLAWLLVSSVDPSDWSETIAAYHDSSGLAAALPSAIAQAFFSFADSPPDSEEAVAWMRRIEEAERHLG